MNAVVCQLMKLIQDPITLSVITVCDGHDTYDAPSHHIVCLMFAIISFVNMPIERSRLKLNGAQQVLFYADCVNCTCEIIHTI